MNKHEKKLHRLITSYDVSNGIIYFSNGTKGLLNQVSASLAEKILYILASHEANFDVVSVSEEEEIDSALDSLAK